MPVYKRAVRWIQNDTDVHVDFVDEVGDSFEEYIVYHRKFLTWMEVNGIDTQKKYSQEEIDELVKRSPIIKLPQTMSIGWWRYVCRAKYRSG